MLSYWMTRASGTRLCRVTDHARFVVSFASGFEYATCQAVKLEMNKRVSHEQLHIVMRMNDVIPSHSLSG